MVLSGNTLYGTTYRGGNWENGTVFKVNLDGTGFASLHHFTATSLDSARASIVHTNSDGANPAGGLVLSGNTLYGTATHGGSSGYGTVFAVNTNGTAFRILYSFPFLGPFAYTTAASPCAGLVLSSNTLYGTTIDGGSWVAGTVFAVNTDGTAFRILHSFGDQSDGAQPAAALILSSNTDAVHVGALCSLGNPF